MAQLKPKSFTITYNGLSPVLGSTVLVSEAFDPLPEKNKPEDHNAMKYNAIWDTGATGTVITQKVVDDCALPSIGISKVQTAAGLDKANVYLANIWLPNKIIVPNVKVTLGKLGSGVSVLIGMNIIGRGDFAVTGRDEKTIFTYRFPSVEQIDFVKNPFKPKPKRKIPQKRK